MAIQRIDRCGEVTVLWIYHRGVSSPVLVDTEDVPRILSFPGAWHIAHQPHCRKYYVRSLKRGSVRGAPVTLLHRFVLGACAGLDVDHRHGDGLDNRKQNLREVTTQQNGMNRQGPNRNSTSGIRGVNWHRHKQKWVARTMVGGKSHHLGYFTDKTEAADAARAAQEQAAAA